MACQAWEAMQPDSDSSQEGGRERVFVEPSVGTLSDAKFLQTGPVGQIQIRIFASLLRTRRSVPGRPPS